MDIVDPRIPPQCVPPESRANIINGPNNEYRDLPAVITPMGHVITRWQPTDAERTAILNGEDIYITLLVDPHRPSINPMFVTIGPVDWTKDPV